MPEVEEKQATLQPVVLVTDHPLMCDCGALAVFVTLEDELAPDGERDFSYTGWCQRCYEQEDD